MSKASIQRVKAQFLNPTEPEVLTIRPHVMQFLVGAAPSFFLFIVFVILLITLEAIGLLSVPVFLTIGLIGSIVALGAMFMAYSDWSSDFTLFTVDKVVLVNSSLFRKKVYPMHYEHVVSATAESQYADLFGFGRIQLQLKDVSDFQEEAGAKAIDSRRINIDFIPDAPLMASKITDILTDFQRRKTRVGPSIVRESQVLQGQGALEQKLIDQGADSRVKELTGKEVKPETKTQRSNRTAGERRRLLSSTEGDGK